MNNLKVYVDGLFFKYPSNKSTDDLKAEILSNLEAKKADLIAHGFDEKDAIERAKASIKNVDALIDGNRNIFIKQFQLESLQISLLYLVIAWFITIPMIIFKPFLSLNLLLLFSIIIVGIIYLVRNTQKTDESFLAERYVNINRFMSLKRLVWVVWALFAVSYVLIMSGIFFASNIWFSRPITIDGPYQFAFIASHYLVLLPTFVVPLIVNRLLKLLQKYEVSENHE
jgi:hypothetical protein